MTRRSVPVAGAGKRTLRVAVFASGSGGNLGAVMRLAARRSDLIEVALVVTDRPGCGAVSISEQAGIPVLSRDFRADCGRASDCRNRTEQIAYVRRAESFHDRIDDSIRGFERSNGSVDLVVLSYARWIHGRLLNRFAGRMINQHPGDLTLLDARRSRVLVGNEPVLSALRLGMPRVRTSTFLVDAGEDAGPILCQGPTIDATGVEAEQHSADDLEQILKRESDWPSVICALTLMAEGVVSVEHGRRMEDRSHGVSICGLPMGFGGLKLMEDLREPDPKMKGISEVVRDAVDSCPDPDA